MTINVKIKKYSNILNHAREINAWNIVDCYDPSRIKEQTKFESIEVAEFIFPGSQGSLEKREAIGKGFERFVLNYLEEMGLASYILVIEQGPSPKSKLKSYKGIFSKQAFGGEYISFERDISQTESLIIAIAKVKPPYAKEIFETLYNSANSIMILSNKDLLENQVQAQVYDRYLTGRLDCLDHLAIIRDYAIDGIFLKIGGDGGDVETSLQLFANKLAINDIIEKAKKVLNREKIDYSFDD
ncbi:hypothetical protein [Pedobacter sp. ASV12]|uniref:hypothetical protein n=1 Tax=Pedobacter sp. ASV12 TaxID=2795120 RepID=UPI0018EBAF7A|nr:hypothetical protein [Pedobacter sp. ASV12]